MFPQSEFKEAMQLLLAEALNTAKRQQSLMEYNRLCIKHKNDQYFKLALNTFETIKKPSLSEVELKALKITILNYKEFVEPQTLARLCALIVRGFPEGSEPNYLLCSECFFLLTNEQSLSQICNFILPLALKLNSQLTQIGSTISLLNILNAVQHVPPAIKKQITSSFVKAQVIVHQAMPDIMCKLVAKDDANLIPIIQRSLIALQDAKNTYQIKQSLCRLLELISKFEVPFDEQLTKLQCVTVLRECTFERVLSLQQQAKSALQSFQNAYIQKNPPVVQSSYFPDLKPFIKKKRGDQHLVLDADNFSKNNQKLDPKRRKPGTSVLNQLQQAEINQMQENFSDNLMEEQIEKEIKAQQEGEQRRGEGARKEEAAVMVDLEATQLFQSSVKELEVTQYFGDAKEEQQEEKEDDEEKLGVYSRVAELLERDETNEAFRLCLEQEDDFLLLRLMMSTDDYFSKLQVGTAQRVIERFARVYKSDFISTLFLSFVTKALKSPTVENLQVGQISALSKLLNQIQMSSF